ncbi:cytochrome c [Pikeienuella piscinae]|uniref:Cytochrome c n=2 Tax=Pikeienuella piscinae TaxID=2748098 RepID=A0A7L5BYH8_9RHOB|nr:cytochrome c [Pikeienuella piscinae]
MAMKQTLTTIIAISVVSAAHAAGGSVERGAYLVSIMDCAGCHSGRAPDGAPDPDAYLAGGALGFELPGLGVFWPPNLTPDVETGLGAWSDEEIVDAIRAGMRPDGRTLAPIMPWESYSVLTDSDAADLVAYLRALPPVRRATPPPVPTGGTAGAPYFAVAMPN